MDKNTAEIIVYQKKDGIEIIIICAALSLAFSALMILCDLSILIFPVIGFTVGLLYGICVYFTRYEFTEEGVIRKCFSSRRELFWDELKFVGVHYQDDRGIGLHPVFVCSKEACPKKSELETWHFYEGKRKTTFIIELGCISDEKYEKIMELCGGERNLAESNSSRGESI